LCLWALSFRALLALLAAGGWFALARRLALGGCLALGRWLALSGCLALAPRLALAGWLALCGLTRARVGRPSDLVWSAPLVRSMVLSAPPGCPGPRLTGQRIGPGAACLRPARRLGEVSLPDRLGLRDNRCLAPGGCCLPAVGAGLACRCRHARLDGRPPGRGTIIGIRLGASLVRRCPRLGRLRWRSRRVDGLCRGCLLAGPRRRHGRLGPRGADRPSLSGDALPRGSAEDLVPETDHGADQQHERQQRDADRDHDKQQAAGNDTRYQQPDCDEHDR